MFDLGSRVSARKKLVGTKKKNKPLMSFRHLKMLNSASKWLNIPLRLS
jgi:hypothetical protein